MSARHNAPHTRVEVKRVYTDARGQHHDVALRSGPCACGAGRDHQDVVEREPYRP